MTCGWNTLLQQWEQRSLLNILLQLCELRSLLGNIVSAVGMKIVVVST
jgi:hypothetical protein